jgi:hypothetical protein
VPNGVRPASAGSVTGRVTLDGGATVTNFPSPAGPIGTVVTLSTSNLAVVLLPASVTIPYRQTSVTFPIKTAPVTVATPVTLTASYAGKTQTAVLTVEP